MNATAINSAEPSKKTLSDTKPTPAGIRLQVLLDRAHFSPGEIDGKFGENAKKALRAYEEAQQLESSDGVGTDVWAKLASDDHPVITSYAISDKDVAGPFLRKLPAKMEAMKDLPKLAYTSAREGLAEKFHMSDKSNALIGFYPATVGSEEKPSPTGTLKVTEIDRNPTYRYNPAYHFKGVHSRKPFTIRPGPNNPVGTMWINLSGEGYGIHGTPFPEKVSKSESHGCVRLTNWDAERVAERVAKGTPVTFVEDPK
jgi:hypothetical protein